MYTLEQLEQKNIKQLKEIGHQLNVFPASDRCCRQNWIDAIVNVNSPLLQLLEASPAASLEQVQPIIETVETPFAVEVEPLQTLPIESKSGCIVYPRLAQKSIPQAAENSPGVESVDPIHSRPTQKAQEYKFFLCLKDGDNTLWYDGKDFVFEQWSAKTYCKRGVGGAKHQLRAHPEVKRVFCSLGNVLQVVENSPRVEQIEVQVQEPIAEAAETSPGVERVTESNRNNFSGFEGVTDSNRNNFSGVERVQELIENSPGVEVDSVSLADRTGGRKFPRCRNRSPKGTAYRNG